MTGHRSRSSLLSCWVSGCYSWVLMFHVSSSLCEAEMKLRLCKASPQPCEPCFCPCCWRPRPAVCCADPASDGSSLDDQMRLKRARLAEDLNEKLALRPGPLELVQKNIIPLDSALTMTGTQRTVLQGLTCVNIHVYVCVWTERDGMFHCERKYGVHLKEAWKLPHELRV